MQRNTFFLISLLLTSSVAFSQDEILDVEYARGSIHHILKEQAAGHVDVTTLGMASPMTKSPTKGSYFLNQLFYLGSIYLYSGQVAENFNFKYDLKYNQLFIKFEEGYGILNGELIKKFTWDEGQEQETTFINGNEFTENGDKVFSGFFKVLVSHKKLSLLSKTAAEYQYANYNHALDHGSTSDKIVKKTQYYLLKGTEVILIDGKKDLSYFGDQQSIIKSYIKKHKLKWKHEEDIIAIITYYNTL